MKSAASALCLALIAPAAAAGQPAGLLRELRFTGPSAVDALCACLLDARRSAEAQGRLDFTAEVEFAGIGGPVDVTGRLWMGVAHAVGHINFAGHSGINDSTLRRAMNNLRARPARRRTAAAQPRANQRHRPLRAGHAGRYQRGAPRRWRDRRSDDSTA